MALSLTKEEFLRRMQARAEELKITPDDFTPEEKVAIITTDPRDNGVNINLGVITGVYFAKLINLVYDENFQQ